VSGSVASRCPNLLEPAVYGAADEMTRYLSQPTPSLTGAKAVYTCVRFFRQQPRGIAAG
jgi:hypothetical protein